MPRERRISEDLFRLARKLEQDERTDLAMLATARRVLASVDDLSPAACEAREYAAITISRDLVARAGEEVAPLHVLQLVRKKDGA